LPDLDEDEPARWPPGSDEGFSIAKSVSLTKTDQLLIGFSIPSSDLTSSQVNSTFGALIGSPLIPENIKHFGLVSDLVPVVYCQ
jgi:hypothetical protein